MPQPERQRIWTEETDAMVVRSWTRVGPVVIAEEVNEYVRKKYEHLGQAGYVIRLTDAWGVVQRAFDLKLATYSQRKALYQLPLNALREMPTLGPAPVNRLWDDSTDSIIRSSWGVHEPKEIAAMINAFVEERYAPQVAAKMRVPIAGRLGRGVVFRACALGLISMEEAERTAERLVWRTGDLAIRDDVRAKVLARDGACRVCGAANDLTLDHIVPHVDGGPPHEENLWVLCRSCNARKNASRWPKGLIELARRERLVDVAKRLTKATAYELGAGAEFVSFMIVWDVPRDPYPGAEIRTHLLVFDVPLASARAGEFTFDHRHALRVLPL